jgi:hypothetical protein
MGTHGLHGDIPGGLGTHPCHSLVEDELLKRSHLILCAGDKHKVVNISQDDGVGVLVNKHTRISLNWMEANRGKVAGKLLVPQTRRATEAQTCQQSSGLQALD